MLLNDTELAILAGTTDRDAIRDRIALFAWDWYVQHPDMVVLSTKIWGFTIKVRVKQLGPLFTALFGPRPVVDVSPIAHFIAN